MKLLTLSLLLLGCSGPAFTEQELYAEGNNTSALGGSSGESNRGGEAGLSSSPLSGAGGELASAGGTSGGLAAGAPSSGSGGAATMAGGPPMGEGGGPTDQGGQSGSASRNEPRECLVANHQTLACASVCDSNPYCQGILDCFVRTNSNLTTDCPGFSSTGYALAAKAERNCCHD